VSICLASANKGYFKYDLGAQKYIKALLTIGRKDKLLYHSENWIAYVGDDDTNFTANTECLGGSSNGGGQEVACNALGRYVIFQKQDDKHLVLHVIAIFEGCDCLDSAWTWPQSSEFPAIN